jgi:hypothetical protein
MEIIKLALATLLFAIGVLFIGLASNNWIIAFGVFFMMWGNNLSNFNNFNEDE